MVLVPGKNDLIDLISGMPLKPNISVKLYSILLRQADGRRLVKLKPSKLNLIVLFKEGDTWVSPSFFDLETL